MFFTKVSSSPLTHQHRSVAPESDLVRYTAVFAIPTPITDDSGIAHAIEHLIFRRSTRFPNPSTLFKINALASVKINASTTDGITYYFCQSDYIDDFLLAFDYLVSNIFSPTFSRQDLPFEVHGSGGKGVIFRELQALEKTIKFRNTALSYTQLLSLDSSNQRISLYGGISDKLTNITVDKLTEYYQTHYRPERVTLYTELAEVKPSDSFNKIIHLLQNALTQRDCFNERLPEKNDEEKQSILKESVCTELNDTLLTSCWIPVSYITTIKQNYCVIKGFDVKDQLQVLPFDETKNGAEQFALRFIHQSNLSKNIDSIISYLVDILEQEGEKATLSENNNINSTKQQDQVSHIMKWHINALRNTTGSQPSKLEVTSTKIYQQAVLSMTKPAAQTPTSLSSLYDNGRGFPASFLVCNKQGSHYSADINSLSYPKAPPQQIPRLFSPLKQAIKTELDKSSILFNKQTSKDLFIEQVLGCYDKDHFLLCFSVKNQHAVKVTVLSYLLAGSSQLLAPRLAGLCYATDIRFLKGENALYIYTAFDINPQNRISSVLEGLTSLQQDTDYLKHYLLSAKDKLAKELVSTHETDSIDLSVSDIQEMIKELVIIIKNNTTNIKGLHDTAIYNHRSYTT
ncbi:insulinase family protein [Psychrobium sp. 1_MG-2023]|uniref:insulinase family protein n=1 Tax=Psychrobium sp. 1_MG-2023 TaxID=3062624 RepID=UPI0026A7BB23|nr:insulinase family protein [Psychrobium sp. 1_MG-2023]MDP2561574.1 insulinase family protein [Psychrobium sp. 1_MG-2023]